MAIALVDEVKQDYIKLFTNKGNTGSNSLVEEWNPSVTADDASRVEYVPTKTFDDIIKEEKLDVGSVIMTKIDVEGMEEAVLKGSSEFLAINDAPIIFEYRLDAVRKFSGKDMRGLLDIFERFEYCLYSLTDESKLSNFNPSYSYENIVAIKRGYNLDGLT